MANATSTRDEGNEEPRQEHALLAFLRSLENEMALEYSRIRSRVKEDPGTAGDESEENWATLLRS
jgi:hypothetical protein